MRPRTSTALTATGASLGCFIAAGTELLRYSPWGDPQALTTGIRFAGAALVFAAFPAALIIAWIVREIRREARKLGLSPAQTAVIGFAVMEVAHHEWSRHNERVSAQLTESVMGPERGTEGPWG